jgi:hypothetical protein
MDLDTFKWLIMFGLGIGGYLMKRSITENDNKIHDLQESQKRTAAELQEIRHTHVHKDDFKDFKVELRGMFEEIRSDLRSLQK